MADGHTVTADEGEVLRVLRAGPAPTGEYTEDVIIYRRGQAVRVRTVERAVARRLARAGLVLIDAGGSARIDPDSPAGAVFEVTE